MKELCHPEKKSVPLRYPYHNILLAKKMRTSSYILDSSALKSVKKCDLSDEYLEFVSTNLISF